MFGDKELEFVRKTFEKSRYGELLKNNLRYERYNWWDDIDKKPILSNLEYEKYLGADVNNFKHLNVIYGLTRLFCKKEKLGEKDSFLLKLAAVIHDWGEAISGDHTFQEVTVEKKEKESMAFFQICDELIQNDSLEHTLILTRTTICEDHYSRLGKMFNAIERIGYMRTALRAWKLSKEDNLKKEVEFEIGLDWIVNNTLHNQISKMIDYAKEFPSVEEYLKLNAREISDAFNKVNLCGIRDNLEMKRYRDAKKIWNIYVKDTGII